MTDNTAALIAEARGRAGNDMGLSDQLLRELADALEAERQRADSVQFALDGFRSVSRRGNAYLIERAERAEAERDRYLEGLYNVYVQLGEDTDGARNAREFFGSMVQTDDPAEWVPRLVKASRDEWEQEVEREETQRSEAAQLSHHYRNESDRYRAAIEEALASDESYDYMRTETLDILTRALDENGDE